MIPTNEGVYVDGCDPLFPSLADFATWERIKRETGRNLNRTLCGSYLVVTSEDDYPRYPEVLKAIDEACRSVNCERSST